MSPDRTGPRGMYRVDRRVPGIGRVRITTGTKSKTVHARREALLLSLVQRGALDTVRALLAGTVTWPEVEYAGRTGRDLLIDVRARQPVQRTVDALPHDATHTRYRVAWGTLTRLGIVDAHTTLADLAVIDWDAVVETWPLAPATWMGVRRMLSRLATLISDDKYSPARRALMRALPTLAEPPRVVTATADDVRALVARLDPRAAVIVRLIVTLGLRRGEAFALRPEHWDAERRRLTIPGTKTADSRATITIAEDAVPIVHAALPLPLSLTQFRRYYEPAARVHGMTVHSLRNLHAMLATEGGAHDGAVRLSMRHGARSLTDRYRLGLATTQVQEAVLRVLGWSGKKSGNGSRFSGALRA